MELGVNENKLILNGKFLLVCVVPFSFYSVNLPDLSHCPYFSRKEKSDLYFQNYELKASHVSCARLCWACPSFFRTSQCSKNCIKEMLFFSCASSLLNIVFSSSLLSKSWILPLSCMYTVITLSTQRVWSRLFLFSYKFTFCFKSWYDVDELHLRWSSLGQEECIGFGESSTPVCQ